MRKHLKRGMTQAPVLAMMMSAAAPVQAAPAAQPAGGGDAAASRVQGGLEEIVVSARRREESIQTAPVAVSAFGAAELELRNVQSSADAANFVPNVQFDAAASESGGGASSQIAIRGIGQTDYVITVEPGVGVYLDGVYVGKSMGSLLDTVDVERMEILRGPQGTLFGKNTIGGAIQLFSKRPTADREAYFEVATGSYDRVDAKGAFSGPLSDAVRMRLSGAYQSRDGHVKRVTPSGVDTGERQGNVDRLSGRFVVEADLSESLLATLAIDGSRIREQTPGQILLKANGEGGLPFLFNAGVPGGVCLPDAGPSQFTNPLCYNSQYVRPLDSYETTASGFNQSDADILGASVRLQWSGPEGMQLTSITAYRDVQVEIAQDLYSSPYFYGNVAQDIDWKQYSQEFQLNGDAANKRLQYVAGLFYSREDATQLFPVNLMIVNFLSGGEVKNDSYAAFGQLTFDVTDKLSTTLGMRYTRDVRRFNPGLQKLVSYEPAPTIPIPGFVNVIDGAFGPPGTPIFPAGWYKRTSNAATPMANVSYRFTPDVMGYATVSKGFKGGGFTMRYFPPVQPAPGTDPDDIISYAGPEKALSYEVGLKSEWFDRRLRLNVAAFYTKYEDIQVTYVVDPDGDGPIGQFVPVLANAGTADMKGLELEVTAAPTEWLRIDGSFGYIDAEYTRFSADALANFPNAINLRLQNTPETTANVGVTLVAFDNQRGRLFARADYSHRSSQYKEFSNDPALFQRGYGILGASVTYVTPGKNWEVAVGGTNLTDEAYIISGETSSEYSRAFVSRPREWYARLKYQF
jgi:iron complex outermembrane receptor protein